MAHSLTPRRLLELVCQTYPLEGIGLQVEQILKIWDIQRYGERAKQLLVRIETSTGAVLGGGSLARLSDTLAPSGLIKTKDWVFCPHCLADDPEPYSRLLWDVGPVTACPIHGMALLRVRACGAPKEHRLTLLQRVCSTTDCGVCGAVRLRCTSAPYRSATEAELVVAKSVSDLIAPSTDLCQPTRDSVRSGLMAVVHGFFEGSVVRAALDSGLPRSSVLTWMRGDFRPNLVGLLSICLRSGADLRALCHGDFVKVRASLDLDSLSAVLPKRTYRLLGADPGEVKSALIAALEDSDPPSLAAIARQFNVGEDALRTLFPDETKALKEWRLKTNDEQRANSFEETVETYLAAVFRLREQGRTSGIKYVQTEASLPAFSGNGFRRRALNEALARAKQRA
jgi:hypothetical protein